MSTQPDNFFVPGGNLYPPTGQFRYSQLEVHREVPKDYLIWSLLCFVYYNPCCLGLAALVHSIKARDRKVLGDIEGAHNYASTARTLNIISTVLFCLFVITVRGRKVLGDVEGGHNYAATGRTLNIISTVLFCLFVINGIIVI